MNIRKILPLVTLSMIVLSVTSCTTPSATQYDFLREDMKPYRNNLTPHDKLMADADCQAEAKRYGATIIFGNFGGRETKKVYLECMKKRGWNYFGS